MLQAQWILKWKNKQTYICSPRYFVFFCYYTNAKREYHDHAQADFDFGQVRGIWWLSYCQVEEKISVEPWAYLGNVWKKGSRLYFSTWATYAWWRHQMEKKSAVQAFVRGIHRSPVNSPHKGQRRWALMFSLICVWINGWVNNREAGDLRRFRTHYDVIVMCRDSYNSLVSNCK